MGRPAMGQGLVAIGCLLLHAVRAVASPSVIGTNYGAGFSDFNVKNASFAVENTVASALPAFYIGQGIVLEAHLDKMDTQDRPSYNAYAATSTPLGRGLVNTRSIYSFDPHFTQALANRIEGSELTAGTVDLNITFNSLHSDPADLQPAFCYGIMTAATQTSDFISISKHEIAVELESLIDIAPNRPGYSGPSIDDRHHEQIPDKKTTLLTAMTAVLRVDAEISDEPIYG